MALLVPLLNDDPCSEKGWELNPPPAVAVSVLGSCNGPRAITLPLTSRVAAGVVVLIPTVAVLPEPDWNSAELPSIELAVQRGMKSVVPEPTTPAVVPASPEPLPLGLPGPGDPGAASTKAEAGSPLMVCASPAFIA